MRPNVGGGGCKAGIMIFAIVPPAGESIDFAANDVGSAQYPGYGRYLRRQIALIQGYTRLTAIPHALAPQKPVNGFVGTS